MLSDYEKDRDGSTIMLAMADEARDYLVGERIVAVFRKERAFHYVCESGFALVTTSGGGAGGSTAYSIMKPEEVAPLLAAERARVRRRAAAVGLQIADPKPTKENRPDGENTSDVLRSG